MGKRHTAPSPQKSSKISTTPIRVSRRHAHDLRLLKEAWQKHSVDEVLEELIAPRRAEQAAILLDREENNAVEVRAENPGSHSGPAG